MGSSPKISTIISKKIKLKLPNFIFQNLLTALPILLVASSILFLKFYGHVSKMHFIFWLVALLTVIACQGALAIWFPKKRSKLNWDNLYVKLLIINAGLIGSL